jgi:hypothetical protein
MSVINIDDYREPHLAPGVKWGGCAVTFLGFTFTTPEGGQGRLNLTVTCPDGDFAKVIDSFKQNGGIFMPPEDGVETYWYLPWPPAAVRIHAIEENSPSPAA